MKKRLLAISFLCACLLSGQAYGATFGNATGTSTSSSNTYENNITGEVFTLSEDGLATSMTASLTCTSANKSVRCLIFRAADTFLVAMTEQKTVTVGTSGEVTFNFVTWDGATRYVRLYAGDYRLCVWGSSAAGFGLVKDDGGTGSTFLVQSATYSVASTVSPMVSSTVTASSPTMHIFCTYTPTSSFSMFGDTTIGSTTSTTEDVIQMGLYTSPASSVIVDSAAAWIDFGSHSATSSTRTFKMALYNVDSTLIASSNEKNIETANNQDGYYNFTFGTPPTIAASTPVRIAIWSDTSYGTISMRYNAQFGNSIRVVSPYTYTPHTGTFPDPALSASLDTDARLNGIAYYHTAGSGRKHRDAWLVRETKWFAGGWCDEISK